MASAIGMSQSSYSMLEQGKQCLTVSDLEKICRTLNISVIELYQKANSMPFWVLSGLFITLSHSLEIQIIQVGLIVFSSLT